MVSARQKSRKQADNREQAPPPPVCAYSKRTSLAHGLVLVVAVIAAYLNSLSSPLIFDDLLCITENPHIRKLWPLSDAMFLAPPDSPSAGRPVVSLSLAINYAIGGLNVRGYHVFNIAVHLACVLILWGIVRRTLILGTNKTCRTGILPVNWTGKMPVPHNSSFLAFAVALIWGVHPLLTESVTYISQRTELLMGLFYLLTLYCAIRAWECAGGNRLWVVAAVAACAVGMGCKEAMVSAPLIVLLYDVTLVSRSLREALRRHATLYLGLAATWLLLAWLNIGGPRSATCGGGLGQDRLDYLRTQADIIVWYLRLCFWPHPLVISYQDWPLARSFLPILPQGLLIVALLALTAWGVGRKHPAAILGVWFFMILAPTSSFVPIVTEPAAERRMYLPLIAVVIAVVLGGAELLRIAKARLAMSDRATKVIAAMAVLLGACALGYGTILRNRDYRTVIGIWDDAVTKRPNNWMAYNNRGAAYAVTGDHDKALGDYNKAVEIKPDYSYGLFNRGRILVARGDYAQAIRDLTKAVEIRTDFEKAFNSRGVAYGAIGEYARGVQDCTKAIELKPDYAVAYYSRGKIHAAKGDYDLAIRDYTRAIELNPEYAEAYDNRGVAYVARGDPVRAIQDYTKSIEIRPDYAYAYSNRGKLYGINGDYAQAIRDCGRAIELKPDFYLAYYNRSAIHGALGDYVQAVKDCTRAIELKPGFAEAYHNRGIAHFSLKEYDKAWRDVNKCRQLGGAPDADFIKQLSAAAGRTE